MLLLLLFFFIFYLCFLLSLCHSVKCLQLSVWGRPFCCPCNWLKLATSKRNNFTTPPWQLLLHLLLLLLLLVHLLESCQLIFCGPISFVNLHYEYCKHFVANFQYDYLLKVLVFWIPCTLIQLLYEGFDYTVQAYVYSSLAISTIIGSLRGYESLSHFVCWPCFYPNQMCLVCFPIKKETQIV